MASVARFLLRTALATALVCLVPAFGWTQSPSEYQVKAAYLYGFGRFTEWPAAAPANSGPSFVVCVLGSDPFGRSLDEVAQNAMMKNKPVRIQRIAGAEDAAQCHTVFIAASEEIKMTKILETVAGLPVLTVSDAPQFAQRGGMVGFVTEGSRVRFAVNVDAAQRPGLTFHSELLRVSATVIKTPRSAAAR